MTGGGGIELTLQQCILLLRYESIHPCPAVRVAIFTLFPFSFVGVSNSEESSKQTEQARLLNGEDIVELFP